MAKPALPLEEIQRARQMALNATAPGALSITDLASRIGYSRTALSLFLSGKYFANPQIVARALLLQLDKLECPFTGEEIQADVCKRRHTALKPFGNPEKLAYWTTCQSCANNPSSEE
ncbi:helix-turn-helix domain-containing protein [Zoogloea sp.]|jgi:hypothetical protein|uniref:helix-turn-helix domain-containing protein n=1 Tax=Zoogloea sp. TaxID=49181 RepID=UPI0037D9FE82